MIDTTKTDNATDKAWIAEGNLQYQCRLFLFYNLLIFRLHVDK